MSKIINAAARPFRWFANAPLRFAIPTLAAAAIILNLFLEMCSRKSFLGLIVHIATSPLIFGANSVIVFATLSLCLLVRRRLALAALISVGWTALGVTNAIVLAFRSSPLSAIDFLIIKDGIRVIGAYFSVAEIILLGALIVVAIALIVWLFIKCPRCKVNYVGSGISVAAAAGLCLIVFIVGMNSSALGDLIAAYNRRGFAYCFAQSAFVHGIERPDDDLIDRTNEFMDKINSGSEGTDLPVVSGNLKAPNIVVVQLESFFDVKYVKGIEFSRDPVPYFTSLKDEGISGFIQVEHVGGGTANIEFEFLTGMNLDHFGLGEFPFTTVLKSRACETLATNLRNLGYSTHAMHNHIATFYGRNIVYPNLGFDTFTTIELMEETRRNIMGWASDSILIDEIKTALDSTENQDLVFAVSVQGHGGYSDHSVAHLIPPTDRDVDLSGFEDEKVYWQYHFYCNLIRQMDDVVEAICNLLEERGEPYVALFYGDHLPALPLTAEQLENGDMYQTEYAIKTNIELPGATGVEDLNELDRDLEIYQLTAYLQELCGMSEGEITRLHQHEFEVGEMFDDILRTLEYKQLYEEEPLYEPTDIIFGVNSVIVDSYSMSGDTLYVTGDRFNRYSKVKIDGKRCDTVFLDSFTLMVENVTSDFDSIEVVQTADDGTELAYAVKIE